MLCIACVKHIHPFIHSFIHPSSRLNRHCCIVCLNSSKCAHVYVYKLQSTYIKNQTVAHWQLHTWKPHINSHSNTNNNNKKYQKNINEWIERIYEWIWNAKNAHILYSVKRSDSSDDWNHVDGNVCTATKWNI